LTPNKGDFDFKFRIENLEHEIVDIAGKGW
jgi:hypothetical protein